MQLSIPAILAMIEQAAELVAKLRAMAKAAGATDAQLDAMDARLTAAHNARQAEAAGQ